MKLVVEHMDGKVRTLDLDANLIWTLQWRDHGVEVVSTDAGGNSSMVPFVFGSVRQALIRPADG